MSDDERGTEKLKENTEIDFNDEIGDNRIKLKFEDDCIRIERRCTILPSIGLILLAGALAAFIVLSLVKKWYPIIGYEGIILQGCIVISSVALGGAVVRLGLRRCYEFPKAQGVCRYRVLVFGLSLRKREINFVRAIGTSDDEGMLASKEIFILHLVQESEKIFSIGPIMIQASKKAAMRREMFMHFFNEFCNTTSKRGEIIANKAFRKQLLIFAIIPITGFAVLALVTQDMSWLYLAGGWCIFFGMIYLKLWYAQRINTLAEQVLKEEDEKKKDDL